MATPNSPTNRTAPRLVAPTNQPNDGAIDASLRPRRLAEYIGQDRVKSTLNIFIQAARKRGESLDHVRRTCTWPEAFEGHCGGSEAYSSDGLEDRRNLSGENERA